MQNKKRSVSLQRRKLFYKIRILKEQNHDKILNSIQLTEILSLYKSLRALYKYPVYQKSSLNWVLRYILEQAYWSELEDNDFVIELIDFVIKNDGDISYILFMSDELQPNIFQSALIFYLEHCQRKRYLSNGCRLTSLPGNYIPSWQYPIEIAIRLKSPILLHQLLRYGALWSHQETFPSRLCYPKNCLVFPQPIPFFCADVIALIINLFSKCNPDEKQLCELDSKEKTSCDNLIKCGRLIFRDSPQLKPELLTKLQSYGIGTTNQRTILTTITHFDQLIPGLLNLFTQPLNLKHCCKLGIRKSLNSNWHLPKDQCDPKAEFNCGDQTCVDIALKCDGEYDCKYRYDEETTICTRALGAGMVLTSEHMIIILVVFFSLVIAMCASISISCYNKIKDRQVREREYKERRSKEASVDATIERNLRGHSSPDRMSDVQKRMPPRVASATNFEQPGPRAVGVREYADDEESSDGCYVPEVDLSVFKHPNGGETIPKKPRAAGLQQQYPFVSESFESLESDVVVPPAPPPVPLHMKERRDISPPPPTYRIVGGKVVANPTKNEPSLERMQKQPLGASRSTLDSKGGSSYGRWAPESRPGSAKPLSGPSPYPGYKPTEKPEQMKPEKDTSGPTDMKSSWLRGPLEAGAPRSAFSRSPGEIGLPKFGMARVTPDGPRGPLASSKNTPVSDKGVPLATFRSPYEDSPYGRGYRPAAARNYQSRNNPEGGTLKTQASIESSDKDSSRAQSAASVLSAPDVIGKR